MNTKISIFTLLLIFLASSVIATTCEDLTPPSNIPCVATAPPLATACGNVTYNITRLSDNQTIITNGNMTSINDGTYTFNITTSQQDDYGIIRCDGATASITIGYNVGEEEYYLYTLSLVIAALLLFIGLKTKISIFTIFSGMIFIIFAITLHLNGIPDSSTFLVEAISICSAGLGFYLVLWSLFDIKE